jgi:cobalt/nickel transport protein
MKQFIRTVTALGMFLLFANVSFAHFGMVIPSDNMVMQEDSKKVDLVLSFSHPFEMVGMPLDMPGEFFVMADGKKEDLKPALKEAKVMDHKAWTLGYTVKKPGAYTFVMEPVPYWEPAEDCFIIHYTKTVVAAFGDDGGWDEELGLKTEIVPLSKPFGLYSGNVFQGIVKLDGKPVPYAEVEVEFYNKDKKASAPSDYMVTQTVKADGNGVFTYAAPVPGWWGFAALNTSDKKMKQGNEEKDIELGAVIWVKFEAWQGK